MMADADDIIATALERFQLAQDGWEEIYQKARDDLQFQSDEPNAQWDNKLLQDRRNRPIYTVDQLSQFVHQVSNDIRMNTPSIDIIPDDEGTDVETAEILQGIIRGIEYKSNADAAYDTAVDFSIKSSIGFIRVDHSYTNEEGFEQELLIKRVINPLAVYIDPNSIEPDGSDAMYGFVLEDMNLKDFQKLYPDASPVSWDDTEEKLDGQKDKVTICEYFEIVENTTEYGLIEGKEPEAYDKKKKDKYKSTRKVKKREVKRYKLAGQDVLEETTFPGKYIPIVPVYGEEAWIDGKRHLKSLIRPAKSSQQMFNLGVSLDIEMLMKQPQASFMAAAGQISGFEHEYADPTKANVLHYNVEDVNGEKLGAPQRVAPPQSAMGFINMSREASDNIRSSLGMYNAAAGKREGDASGVALRQLDKSSDVGNYHFGDNLVRSITHLGKIIVCAFGKIYDTPRAVKMVDKEDNTKMVGINGHRVPDQERDYFVNDGQYDVRVITGPSFTTQRQEAAANYSQIIQAMPDLMPVIGDLVFKYQDTAGSQAISARLRKIVDPKLLSDEEKDKDQPDPQVAALTQQLQLVTEEATQQIQALQAQLDDKQAELMIKQEEVNVKKVEAEAKVADSKTKQIQAIAQFGSKKKTEAEGLSPASAPQSAPINPNDSVQVLQVRLQEALENQQREAEEEAQEQQMMAMAAQAEQEDEDRELETKIAEMTQREQQGNAILQVLSGIQQALAIQTAQQAQIASTPMKVLRNEQGEMVGAV